MRRELEVPEELRRLERRALALALAEGEADAEPAAGSPASIDIPVFATRCDPATPGPSGELLAGLTVTLGER